MPFCTDSNSVIDNAGTDFATVSNIPGDDESSDDNFVTNQHNSSEKNDDFVNTNNETSSSKGANETGNSGANIKRRKSGNTILKLIINKKAHFEKKL